MVTKTHIANQEEGQEEKAPQLRAADPGTPFEGQLWINKADQKIRYQNGTVKEIGTLIGGGTSLPEEGFANYISTANKQAVPFTSIDNRAEVNYDLRPGIGKERIYFRSRSLIEDEHGSDGETVYEIESQDERVRLIGAYSSNTIPNYGTWLQGESGGSTIEVTFYGTGLNLVCAADHVDRDMRVTVDGNAEEADFFTGHSAVLQHTESNSNQIVPVKSGLTLGIHTLKVRSPSSSTRMYGIEILNDSAQFSCRAGNAIIQGATDDLLVDSLTDYNQGVVGTKGARVVKYLEGNAIKSAVQEVDASQLDLAAADHSNEEVSSRLNFRKFGVNSSKDFSTIGGGFNDRAFTLDDGITTLVGNDVGATDDGFDFPAADDGVTLTFVGTGLDVYGPALNHDGAAVEVFIDGDSIGIMPAGSGEQTIKIVSGLPYGAHSAYFVRVGGALGRMFNTFIIYQPKKPAIPASGMEVADYNVMADYVFKTVAAKRTISTGVLRKMNTREFLYTGTWSAYGSPAGGDSFASGYQALETNTATGASFEITITGTGFDFTTFSNVSTCGDALMSLNGVALTAANFPTAVFDTVGAGNAYNDTTGSYDGSDVGSFAGSAFSCSGLPMGTYTVKALNGGDQQLRMSSLDVHTPIHSAKGVDASSMKSERNYSAFKEEDINKEELDGAAAYLVYNSNTNEIIESKGVSSVVDESAGIFYIYWEKDFIEEPRIIAGLSENRMLGIESDDRKSFIKVRTRQLSTSGFVDTDRVTMMVYGKQRD